MAAERGHVIVDTDKRRLDLDVIYDFLSKSYWSPGIPRETVQRAVENSLCFGVYVDGRQVGFARVISDLATFAHVADVFVVEPFRGCGLSKRLMDAIVAHPDLHRLRRWTLVTRDAHGLYSRYGFAPLATPERFMELNNPNVYQRDPKKAGDQPSPQ